MIYKQEIKKIIEKDVFFKKLNFKYTLLSLCYKKKNKQTKQKQTKKKQKQTKTKTKQKQKQ